jgi:hypothetical protein
MPSFAVLWLLALQLLALAAPRSVAVQRGEGGRAPALQAIRTEETTSPLRSARIATLAEPRAPHAAPRPTPAAPIAPAPLRGTLGDAPPSTSLDRSHATASRGGLLPYFPTAPPVVG